MQSPHSRYKMPPWFTTVEWKNGMVRLLDQRARLPEHVGVLDCCRDYRAVADAIRELKVRGRPRSAAIRRLVLR
ncbi:MAG: hypothetical protein U0412_10435 [Nitrospira sp.]